MENNLKVLLNSSCGEGYVIDEAILHQLVKVFSYDVPDGINKAGEPNLSLERFFNLFDKAYGNKELLVKEVNSYFDLNRVVYSQFVTKLKELIENESE